MSLRQLRLTCQAALVCALLGIGSGTGPAAAEQVLTPAEMRAAAAQSLKAGLPDQALRLSEALTARDPGDLGAHLIRARALRDLGRTEPALAAARTAWSLAETPADRYAASLITAQVLSTAGHRTRAQLWLRRAVHHAPNPALAARAKRDFAYVKSQNPWQTHLSFTLAPNSNINNGSARERSFLNYALSESLFGAPVEYSLEGAARALSGLEIGAGVKSRYRFRQTETVAQDLTFGLSYRSFVLSDSARAQAPDVSGSDFAFGTVSLGYGIRAINFDRRGEIALHTSLGQTFYGGARYSQFGRATLAQTWKRSPQQSLRFEISGEHQDGQRTADKNTLTLTASLNQRLASGGLAFFSTSLEQATSPDADREYHEIELRGGYVLARPVLGAVVQFGLGAALRDYDVSPHSPAGREDKRLFADVTATFKQIDYYGFNPSVTLSGRTSDSNIGLYDLDRVGLSVGIKSSF